jgi:hypothetical protein
MFFIRFMKDNANPPRFKMSFIRFMKDKTEAITGPKCPSSAP